MLEKQKWIHFEQDIFIEWQQSKDEGRLVDNLKDTCVKLSKQPRSQAKLLAVERMLHQLDSAPLDKHYVYCEPSDLDEIRAQRPEKRHRFETKANDEHQLQNKLTGAWVGRVSGCMLGKPVEGYLRERLVKLLKGTQNWPLARYITSDNFTDELVKEVLIDSNACWADKFDGIAPVDDDTNYTVFTLKLIETYGKDFCPNDVLEAWLSWIPMFCTFTAERAAYRNAAAGMLAPQTARYKNPYREWIGAQIRGDFYGYINFGNPEKAAEMAWKDACISHTKNGIYGEMFAAAMIAAAGVCDDVLTVIEAGLDEIPLHSRLRKEIDLVIEWNKIGLSFDKITDNIHQLYDEAQSHCWCHTLPNAMIVVAALLYGNKDFGKTICLAVQAAFDTDCNGATAGSILGTMLGTGGIPACWSAPYNNRLATATFEYTDVTVAELVKKTIQIIKTN